MGFDLRINITAFVNGITHLSNALDYTRLSTDDSLVSSHQTSAIMSKSADTAREYFITRALFNRAVNERDQLDGSEESAARWMAEDRAYLAGRALATIQSKIESDMGAMYGRYHLDGKKVIYIGESKLMTNARSEATED